MQSRSGGFSFHIEKKPIKGGKSCESIHRNSLGSQSRLFWKELVWKNWTSQKAVLSDKLLGSCRYLVVIPGSPVNLIRRPIVKSLMRPNPIIELEINP